MSIDYCLQRARELPYIRKQSRHYACLVDKKGRIVVESANSYSCSHTTQYRYAKKAGRPEAVYLHAEMACLLKDRYKRGVKMFVVRVDKAGEPVYSAPCEICSLAIEDFSNVKSVEYTT